MNGASGQSIERNTAVSPVPPIVPKLQEARRIVESARWSLLDVVIWLNEIEDDILRGSKVRLRAALDDLDTTGLTTNRADSEAREYRPEDYGVGGEAV